jgi:hypothetical protein
MGIWLVIAATGLGMGMYYAFTKGMKDALYFFIIAVVAVLMFFINRRRFKMYVNPVQAEGQQNVKQ